MFSKITRPLGRIARRLVTDKRKHNALKHGVFSGTQLLPGEDEAEFMRHVMRVLEEFAPSGPIEIDCVATIAKYSWRKFNLNFEAYQKFDVSSFNRRLDLEAKCDAMIDRAIKRLLQVRGIKSLASSLALAPKETPNRPALIETLGNVKSRDKKS